MEQKTGVRSLYDEPFWGYGAEISLFRLDLFPHSTYKRTSTSSRIQTGPYSSLSWLLGGNVPVEPEKECRGTLDERVKMLLATCGCRLVKLEDIIQSIRDAGRGKRWTWVEKWVEEEGPKYVNDMDTVVFDFPSGGLSGEKSLEFTQWVWRLQPSVFAYQVWSGRCFVRMWWDRNRFQNR